jgi:DNA-binding PadR family transcriptional regulator
MAALGMLGQRPGSGYDLMKILATTLATVWSASQSQVYTELVNLADAGLIDVVDIGPRGRKVYDLTPAGRTELIRWLVQPADHEPRRDGALLHVVFLGEIPAAEARTYVVAMTDHADAEVLRLCTLRDSYRWPPADDNEMYGRAALEHALRGEATTAEWGRWLIELLDRRLRSAHPPAAAGGEPPPAAG